MRISILAIIITLICACTSATYYDQILTSWRDQPASSLIQHWGQPNTKIKLANGNSYYVYTTETRQPYPYPSSNFATIVAPNGRAIASQVTNGERENTLNVSRCITSFSVNPQGVIVGVKSQGFCTTPKDIVRPAGD